MKKLDADGPETKSADIVAGNIDALKSLFPDAFTEGRIDFEVLKGLLGGAVDERDEKYGLNWHGKRRARQVALMPSTGTLLPCPNESVDWDSTQNLMIEGDNLEVLKLLQKSYASKVKLIYIDPPYNTGKDFVYPDNFRDSIANYLELTGQLDGGRKIISNSDSSGRFHTDWLNMMYPRIKLARNLLRSDGALFITIGDVECDNATKICNEVFGEENFQAHICWQKKYAVSQDDPGIGTMHDHILVFSKGPEFKRNLLARNEKQIDRYKNADNDPRGPWAADNYLGNNSKDERPTLWYPIKHPITGRDVWPKESAVWRYSKDKHLEIEAEGRLYWGPSNNYERPRIKRFLNEIQDGVVPSSWWPFEEVGHNDEAQKETAQLLAPKVFTTPKPVRMLRRCLDLATSQDSVVMDFFAGSGSMAHAVLEQNAEDSGSRRYIMVQLPEPLSADDKDQKIAAEFCDEIGKPRTIAELTKERLRRAAKKIKEENPLFSGDTGFRAFKLAGSNILAWEPNAADLENSLLKNAEHLVPGRKEEDVLYELLLKLGLDLCVPIETKILAGKTVHSIGGGALIACLADGLTKEVIEPLASGIVAWRASLAPAVDTRVVFKDSGFVDDIAKTNMAAILTQNGISDVRSL
jgi:adenine-specific DNA-methyltransferase